MSPSTEKQSEHIFMAHVHREIFLIVIRDALALSPNHCLCVSTTKIGENPPKKYIFLLSTRKTRLGSFSKKKFVFVSSLRKTRLEKIFAHHTSSCVYRAANVKEN